MTCPRLLLLGLLAFSAVASSQTDLAGGWAGELDTPGPSRRPLLIEFASAPRGWAGGAEISGYAPLSFIRSDGRQVSFEATTETDPGHWSFRGNISEDRAAINGTATLGPDSYPFHLERNDAALGLLAASAETVGEDYEGFSGRWESEQPTSDDGFYVRMILHQTAYGVTGNLERWGRYVSDVRLTRVETAERRIRFELPKPVAHPDNFVGLVEEGRDPRAEFEGVMIPGDMEIRGVWTQYGQQVPLVLRRAGEPGLGH
ncbi:MAG: hypothetical protein O3A53_07685 [Acidobacteria bacterium]|nr:hypothetical protein [Acidobacteriota bacterium]MDA1234666.1 hypothetical protein [Acidobacteriota bacterium]